MKRTIALLVVVVLVATVLVVPGSNPVDAQGGDAWPPAPQVSGGSACSERLVGSNRTFNVGPGRQHTELTTVPWLSLTAGDVVNVYHRAQPYRTKLGLRAQGTATNPVVINGVTSSDCRRPVISGENAVTSDDAVASQFFNKQYTEFLGTIFLYRASSDPFGYRPTHITIQNLKITGASAGNEYTGQDGQPGTYANGAAGVYAVVVEDLTLVNNEITGNGNGVFVNTKSTEETSRRIVVRRNSIHSNGVPGSYLEHNLYIQARRALYEGNYIGQLVPGAQGSSLKDRSSGTVVRFNHIDAASRALDLVEIEGGVGPVKNDPLYSIAWVYGNLIVTDHHRPGLSGALLIHWGGDNAPEHFRNGTLHFYNNTVVIQSTRAQRYWFAIFDMDNNQQDVVAHSNMFVNAEDAFMYLGDVRGTIELTGTNWLTEGWGEAGGFQPDVTVDITGTVLDGTAARLSSNYRPWGSSPAVDAVTTVPVVAPSPAIAANLRAEAEFSAPVGTALRAENGLASDLGAFESASAGVNPTPTPTPRPTTKTCSGRQVTVDLAAGQSPTNGDDVIYGTDGADAIHGRGGDDVICGAGGDDLITGGPGNDLLIGGAGDDIMLGDAGNDTLRGDAGNDILKGGGGDDTLKGSGDDNALDGGSGADELDGGSGNDQLLGLGGNDNLKGGSGADFISGGFGTDIVTGGNGQDTCEDQNQAVTNCEIDLG